MDEQAISTNGGGIQGTEDVDNPEAEADLPEGESAGEPANLKNRNSVPDDVREVEDGSTQNIVSPHATGEVPETDGIDAEIGSYGEKTSSDSIGTSEYGTARESAGGSDLGNGSEQADEHKRASKSVSGSSDGMDSQEK
ncbi:hypothetical protein B9Z65_8241 [Elsinoe australis]|uniref:Uncharacterized protein n=1 Tax=Elsinoe australis TaxID=40998 RepID=A0A2P7ZMK3_9PEZI|nr:hypothetical protein B9Z65_8241 [Elsinoe australis]